MHRGGSKATTPRPGGSKTRGCTPLGRSSALPIRRARRRIRQAPLAPRRERRGPESPSISKVGLLVLTSHTLLEREQKFCSIKAKQPPHPRRNANEFWAC